MVVLFSGTTSGLQPAVLCQHKPKIQTFYLETLSRMKKSVLQIMARTRPIRFSLR